MRHTSPVLILVKINQAYFKKQRTFYYNFFQLGFAIQLPLAV